MIIGLDNANTFHKWVNYQDLERLAQFVVVPRKGVERDLNVNWYLQKPHIFLNSEDTNIIDVSSTEIRHLMDKTQMTTPEWMSSRESDILEYLDPNVLDYIKENKLYNIIV
jgi:nicotinic acid mononucleotide adenylyltransferase